MIKIKGKVIKGKKRGEQLGFPTANLLTQIKIKEGIYISKTKIGNVIYPSLTFAGSAVTYNEEEFKVENYILDYASNLYAKELEVVIIKKIRNNKKFGSEQELIDAMKEDERIAREYFKKNV